MAAERRSIGINVVCCVNDDQLDDEDIGVAGAYVVTVPVRVPDTQAASIALDAFHEDVAIAVLDDFDIDVFDLATGKVLYEADDTESYRQGQYGSVEGKLDDTPWRLFTVTAVGTTTVQIEVIAPDAQQARLMVFNTLRQQGWSNATMVLTVAE